MSEPIRYGTRGAIIYQTVDDETVILNLDNGRYYSMNATASAVWECLMKGYPLDEIAASFAQPDAAATRRTRFAGDRCGRRRHADHVTGAVGQRSAAVAGVDGGVRLHGRQKNCSLTVVTRHGDGPADRAHDA